MRRAWTLAGLTGLLLLAAHDASLAAGPWRTVRPAGEKKTLPRGKTLSRSASPDRRYVLLLRDEGEKGDFFWRSVYVQHGGSYTLLQTCNSLRGARWSGSPEQVRYQIDAATGPTRMERVEVTYTPATRLLRRRVLRVLKVEAAG